MAHQRKVIRNSVATILSGATSAGTNIYTNRVTNHEPDKLPAISIFTEEETATPRDLSGRTSIRSLTLRLEVTGKGGDTIDDTLDDLASDIETLIIADRSLGGTCSSLIYQSTNLELDDSGESQVARLNISYQITYIA